MARGHQKELAQQRNAKKNSGKKDASNQKKAAGAALIHQCTVCKVNVHRKLSNIEIYVFQSY
jgi:hypothetical protein